VIGVSAGAWPTVFSRSTVVQPAIERQAMIVVVAQILCMARFLFS
jgi:hypothetical protein